MAIICRHLEHDYLCGGSGDPKWAGIVSLIAHPTSPLVAGLRWVRDGSHCHATAKLVELKDARFFPDARWLGARVVISGWAPRSAEPLLMCGVERDEIDPRRWFGRPEACAVDIDPEEFMIACREIGWSYSPRDGNAGRLCRVDELELTEGPPPEGVF